MSDLITSLDDAVNGHTDWKIKLRGAISGRERLDVESVADDGACQFGLWLNGAAGERYRAQPAHQDCQLAHRQFHACAADVALLINAGDYAKAERMLGPGRPYALAARRMILAIELMRQHLVVPDAEPGLPPQAL